MSKGYVNVKASGASRTALEEDGFRLARDFFGNRACLEIAYQYSTQKDSADGLYHATLAIRELGPYDVPVPAIRGLAARTLQHGTGLFRRCRCGG